MGSFSQCDRFWGLFFHTFISVCIGGVLVGNSGAPTPVIKIGVGIMGAFLGSSIYRRVCQVGPDWDWAPGFCCGPCKGPGCSFDFVLVLSSSVNPLLFVVLILFKLWGNHVGESKSALSAKLIKLMLILTALGSILFIVGDTVDRLILRPVGESEDDEYHSSSDSDFAEFRLRL